MPSIRLRRPAAVLVSLLAAWALWLAATASAAEPSAKALPRCSPEQQGISSSAILAFIEAADKEIDSLHSFMLVRHGHVVAEGWWSPYDSKTPHILYSLSKSFTSTAVGLAVAEGKFSVDDEVLKFFPEEAPAEPSANLRAMRVSDLLRMNTGHQTEAMLWRDEPGKQRQDTWVKKFLAHPVPFKPGTHFMYNSPATYMLSAIVQKTTGMTVLDYLRPRLFEPLGIENPSWIASPQGITVGAFGLLVRTEDIARFGQLYLQKGQWQGRRLLPAAWVEEATARQTSNGSNPKSDWDQGYGYQFWRSRHHAYRGDGAFGQYCVVIPELDTVVAITGGLRDMQRPLNLVWEKLLPALKPGSLPDDAAAQQKLQARLASLRMRMPSGKSAAALTAKISGQTYHFPKNDRGINSMALDLAEKAPRLVIRMAAGESKTPIGLGNWTRSNAGFANGLDRLLGVPEHPVVATSGAWTADDVFSLKIVLCETPYYSTLTFRFDGDRLVVNSDHNVGFGPTKQQQLVGQAKLAARDGATRPLVRADHAAIAPSQP